MCKQFCVILLFFVFNQLFSQKNVSVKIDKSIEAISIFYTLATKDTLERKPTPSTYFKDFNNYFENYKNHKSINWYKNLNNWDGFDLSTIGLFLSNKYPFTVELPHGETYLKSSNMTTFLYNFNEFYKDCKVQNFIKTHKREYSKIATFAKESIIASEVLNDAKNFYNKLSTQKIIIFVDILNNLGNNAIEIHSKTYIKKKIFKLAYLQSENLIQTNNTDVQFVPLPNVVFHELSHLFVNDFVPKYNKRLSIVKKMFLITSKNEMLDEKEWQNELEELLVRVCVSKILGKKYGAERELKEVEIQSKHFKYFKGLNEFFNNYTENRVKYKTITDFYPEIIKFIENLK